VIVTGNHHLRKHVHIGEVAADGQFRIVSDGGAVMPEAWSQWLPENVGYRCDWTRSGPDAERFLASPDGGRS
jgi:urea transport system substrate-binding protein